MDLESLPAAAFVGDHSHSVTVYDAGDKGSQPYFVSQYLASGSVAELLQRAEHYRLSLARALAIADHLAKFVPQAVKRLIVQNPEAPELEKREQDVSVLFVDISGYTRLSEALPQEQVNFIVERYFSSFLDCIYANGGDISETAGDGLMVIFPAAEPTHHARNAVKAALEILQKTTTLNAQLQGAFEPIAVHIGINSGPALVGPTKLEGATGARWTYTASGLVTTVAARITALGEEGTALIGAETARRVRGFFAMRELGKRQLKNVTEAVMIYQINSREDTHAQAPGQDPRRR